MVSRASRRWLTGLLAAVVVAGCDTSLPSAEPDDGGAIRTTMERRDGVVVSLTLDRVRVETGGRIQAVAEVTNLGPGPVTWQSGGCELQGQFTLEGPDIPQPPPGRDWPDTAHWAKWSATTSGVGMVGLLAPGFPVEAGMVCPADLRVEDLAAGATVRINAIWPGQLSDGTPAPAGPYRASFTFPYLARVPADQFVGDAHLDQRPIQADLAFIVEGQGFEGISSVEAVDRAHADRRLAAWIATIAHQELNGASIRLDKGMWQYEIATTKGTARIAIDPNQGAVVGFAVGP
jgi:hypothetical protein